MERTYIDDGSTNQECRVPGFKRITVPLEILGFFVNKTEGSLHDASASKTSDGWLGYALDVITKDLSVIFINASFSKSFTSFTATRHFPLIPFSPLPLR